MRQPSKGFGGCFKTPFLVFLRTNVWTNEGEGAFIKVIGWLWSVYRRMHRHVKNSFDLWGDKMEPRYTYYTKKLPEVMNEYNLSSEEYEVIKVLKFDKVWLVKDKKYGRKLVVKRLEKTKSIFPILLHQKLDESSLLVPPVIPSKDGMAYVQIKERYFYVNEFVGSLKKIPTDKRIEALAAFHKTARFEDLRGIDEDLEEESLEEFLKDYSLKVKQMIEWADSVKASDLKEQLVRMTRMGLKVYQLIQNYDVNSYLEAMKARHSICHADYNSNNAYLTKEGKCLIMDFDFANYGPPIKDFRFLNESLMLKRDQDMKDILSSLFTIYFNQLSEDKRYKHLYILDSMFPHVFYNQAASIVMKEGLKGLERNKKRMIQLAKREKEKYRFLLKEELK